MKNSKENSLDYINLLKNYNKEVHEKNTKSKNQKLINLNYIFSNLWEVEENMPYVAKTHLLDSYYCLPNRPDMAFTFLWKSINSSYNELWLKGNPDNKERLTDTKSLTYMIKEVSSNSSNIIENDLSIINLIRLYSSSIPIKTTKFLATLLLKNYAIEKKYPISPTDKKTIATKHISSSYTTFKKQFKEIYNPIVEAYGEAYLKIVNPTINDGSINMNISNQDSRKSEQITNSLAEKIRELLIDKTVNFSNSDETKSYEVKLKDDEEYIKFIVINFLYAIRNNTVHGKIASRLNSKTKNDGSYESAVFIYLLGYMFFSLSLYQLDYIKKEDLTILHKNYIDNLQNIKTK